MSCDRWQERMDAYLDGELPEAEGREFEAHLQTCNACSAEALARSELKRSIHLAGKAFAPNPEFRRRMQESIAAKPRPPVWLWIAATASICTAVLLIVLGPLVLRRQQAQQEQRLLGELTDLHVTTLAGSNRVDVLSSDKHTVKPWFQGKLPFTFNLPDLQGSPFTLVGGKLSYIDQDPAAELLYTVRQHVLSVFILKDSPELDRAIEDVKLMHKLSFNIESWSAGGLRYFIVTDAGAPDVDDLRARFTAAAQ